MSDDIQALSLEELDRDYAEICSEIDFLEAQLRFDPECSTPDDLEYARRKISEFKKRRDWLRIELEKRQKSPI